MLRNRYPVVMAGGMHIADVRDGAAVLAAVMQPGRGPRSHLVTGHYVTMPGIIGTLGDLTGRRIRFVRFPAGFLAAFGRAADLAQRRLRRARNSRLGAPLRLTVVTDDRTGGCRS